MPSGCDGSVSPGGGTGGCEEYTVFEDRVCEFLRTSGGTPGCEYRGAGNAEVETSNPEVE